MIGYFNVLGLYFSYLIFKVHRLVSPSTFVLIPTITRISPIGISQPLNSIKPLMQIAKFLLVLAHNIHPLHISYRSTNPINESEIEECVEQGVHFGDCLLHIDFLGCLAG